MLDTFMGMGGFGSAAHLKNFKKTLRNGDQHWGDCSSCF